STYTFGFVYLDNLAGLTFHLEGTFRRDANKFIVKKQPITNVVKQRLGPNDMKVAIIPKVRFEELKVDEFPEWLKTYKGNDTLSVARLYMLGVTYNQWRESNKALYYLDRASIKDPGYKGLSYEYAFAYNATKQYKKAIEVLDKAFVLNPNDCNLLKEQMFAQMNLKEVDKAIETCVKAFQSCPQRNVKSEMLYNICYHYFKQKNKREFKKWTDEARKFFSPSDEALKVIAKMEAEIER
ncbi:MAG: tetratricopeptide repeat protein, partial [Bacteroidia bacterium]